MLPTPATRRWSSRNAFTGALRPRAGARQHVGREARVERLGAEALVEIRVERVAAVDHEAGAEAALVDEQQPVAVVEHEAHAQMRPRAARRPARRPTAGCPVMRRCMTRKRSSSSSRIRYLPRRPSATIALAAQVGLDVRRRSAARTTADRAPARRSIVCPARGARAGGGSSLPRGARASPKRTRRSAESRGRRAPAT